MPKVLAREHCLADTAVAVKPYYKWLGCADSQTHIPHESQLIDFVTVQCEPKALDYILCTPVLKTEIETRLERDSCLITWPQSRGDPLELKFKKTSGQRYPEQDWANKCQSVMDKFLSDIRCETVNILQEIWNRFKTQVEERVSHQNFMVKYVFDSDHCDLNFVGKKDASEKFKTMVESIKTSLEEELRKKHEQITETITSLSPHQLMILCLCNYADEVAAAAENVKVVITQNEVHMTGMPDVVKRVRLKIYEKISHLHNDMITVSEAHAELMEKESVKSHLLECFRHRQVVASWSIRNTELSIFAFDRDQLTKAKEIIQSLVVEKEFSLDASSKPLLSQPEWKEFEKQLTAEHKMVVIHTGKEGLLVLCCIKEFSDAIQQVQDFIEKNSLVQKLHSLMRPVADLLEQFMSSDLEKVGSKLSQCGGHMKRADDENEPGFVLLGNRSAVEWASSELVKLTETLAMFDHEIDRPGVPEYLLGTSGAAILNDLQRKHQVIIDLESCRTSPAASAAGRRGNAASAALVKCSRKVCTL